MKKYDESLFRIGEAAKILGVSRKMVLNYENLGLLTPAVKDTDSGFRYFTADNMSQIRSIRSLQALGLSLKEIAEYYRDMGNVENHLQRLMEFRAALDRNIQMLQVRAARQGDLTVCWATLPRQVCFCRGYRCADVAEATINLRDTYIAAARTGQLSMSSHMFTVRHGGDGAALDLLCCIPVTEDFAGPERQEFPETPAVCVYYRGPYEGMGTAMRALADYLKVSELQAIGDFRSTYLEGPPSRGANTADYITQVAVPVADHRRFGAV